MNTKATGTGTVSYALCGEDLIIASLLRQVESGTYIDVGANHPSHVSNTLRLYEAGWSGLAVDGNGAFAPLWAQQRPRDMFVQALVSDAERDVEFAIFPDDTMSSMNPETASRYASRFRDDEIQTQRARTTLVSTLRQTHLADREIHLLCVDVEGEDLNVLRGADLAQMQPGVIVVETKGCSLHHAMEHEIVAYLTGLGYRLVAKSLLDAFFVWPDKPYLNWIPKSLL